MAEAELPEALTARLKGVRRVAVITGAGLSAESGIPTYRGRGGLYDDPAKGDDTIEALSGETFARDPDRTWRVVAELARRSAAAAPNAGHRALVAIEDAVEEFVLLTQNVDGLHQRAGSRNVIAIHGHVLDTLCTACGEGGALDRAGLAALDAAPRCPGCGGILRPDVVLFGEMLPMDGVQRLHDAFYRRPPDVVIVAGTSGLFPYIAEPVVVARRAGRLTIEIDPEVTALSAHAAFALRGPAGVHLPAIARALGA